MKAGGGSWSFPIRTDPTGGIALVRGARELEEALVVILGTRPGERRMWPEFGCRLPDLRPGVAPGAEAERTAALEVRTALARWEPRIEVLDVTVTEVSSGDALLEIDVQYRPIDTGEARHLRYRPRVHVEPTLDATEP